MTVDVGGYLFIHRRATVAELDIRCCLQSTSIITIFCSVVNDDVFVEYFCCSFWNKNSPLLQHKMYCMTQVNFPNICVINKYGDFTIYKYMYNELSNDKYNESRTDTMFSLNQ